MAEYKKLPDGTIVKVAGQGGIADNLTTLSPVMSLSAKQGNVLDTNKAERLDISARIYIGTKNTTGSQIASGTYFYLNGELVKAKTAIANNDDFTRGTNFEAVRIGNVLKSLTDYTTISNKTQISAVEAGKTWPGSVNITFWTVSGMYFYIAIMTCHKTLLTPNTYYTICSTPRGYSHFNINGAVGSGTANDDSGNIFGSCALIFSAGGEVGIHISDNLPTTSMIYLFCQGFMN